MARLYTPMEVSSFDEYCVIEILNHYNRIYSYPAGYSELENIF